MSRLFRLPTLFRRANREAADLVPPIESSSAAASPVPADTVRRPLDARESVLGTDAEFLEAMYWIVLGRPLDDEWRKKRTRHLELGQSREDFLRAALASAEFRQRYHDVLDSTLVISGEEALEAALQSLGTNAAFIDACYLCLLGRDADPEGRAHYVSLLEVWQENRQSRA